MAQFEFSPDGHAEALARHLENGAPLKPELLARLNAALKKASTVLERPETVLDVVAKLRKDDFDVLMATDGFAPQLSLAMFGSDDGMLRRVLDLCDEGQKQSILAVLPPALTTVEVGAAKQFLFDRIAALRASGTIQPVKAV